MRLLQAALHGENYPLYLLLTSPVPVAKLRLMHAYCNIENLIKKKKECLATELSYGPIYTSGQRSVFLRTKQTKKRASIPGTPMGLMKPIWHPFFECENSE